MRAIYSVLPDNGRSLEIDDNTALWLMRMCVGEGGRSCSRKKASALLWAITNRYLLYPATERIVALAPGYGNLDPHEHPFVGVIRMFSQPINRRWMKGGDKAIKWAGTEFASPARLKRRAEIVRLTDIPDRISRAVTQFAEGLLFPPEELTRLNRPRISDWASLKKTPQKFPWGINIAGDWFFESRILREGTVIVRLPGDNINE